MTKTLGAMPPQLGQVINAGDAKSQVLDDLSPAELLVAARRAKANGCTESYLHLNELLKEKIAESRRIAQQEDDLIRQGKLKRKKRSNKGEREKIQRYIYALIFPDSRCYIGMSIDPHRRFKEHRRAFADEFRPFVIDEVFGNTRQAGFREHAWRYAAFLAGWNVYESAPCNPYENLAERVRINTKKHAETLTWSFKD